MLVVLMLYLIFVYLTQIKSKGYYTRVLYNILKSREKLLMEVDTGDIVLFDRPCLSMGIWGGMICMGAKFLGGTKWDHVGVVIRDPETKELFVLEAALSGVKLRSFNERIKRSKSNAIAIRRLQVNREFKEFHQRAMEFAIEMKSRPYEDRILPLFNAGVVVPSRSVREHVSNELLRTERQITRIQTDLQSKSQPGFATKTLDHELTRLRSKHSELTHQLQQTEVSLFENQNDPTKLFCSELVAGLYQYLGILPTYPPANSFTPQDFSQDTTSRLALRADAALSPEEYIKIREGEVDSSVDAEIVPEREKILYCLRRHKYFSTLTDAELSCLVKKFRRRVYYPGQLVYSQGTKGDEFYIVESGTFEAHRDTNLSFNYAPKPYCTKKFPGNSFGGSSLSRNAPRWSTVRASSESDATACLWCLDKDDFDQAVELRHKETQRCPSELIESHPILSTLSHKELTEAFYPIELPANATVIRQGEYGSSMFVIKEGKCRVVRRKPNGKMYVDKILGPGDTFGEASILYDCPRGATVETLEPTQLLALSKSDLPHRSSGSLYELFLKRSVSTEESEYLMPVSDFEHLVFGKRKESIGNRLVCPDDSGMINFSQFMHFYFLMTHKTVDQALPEVIFRLISDPGQQTGAISRKDLQRAMDSHDTLTDEFYRKWFGPEGKDTVSYHQFLRSLENDRLPQDLSRLVEKTSREFADFKAVWTTSASHWGPLETRESGVLLPKRYDSPLAEISCAIASGIVARTFSSPLERLKILMQTSTTKSYRNLSRSMWSGVANHGIKTLFLGNGIHCFKMIPSFPLKLYLCDVYRDQFLNIQSPEVRNVLAGGLAGITANAVLYPLDFLRGQVTVTGKTIGQIYTKEKLTGLYRGFLASSAGAFPYIGLNYAVYEFLQPRVHMNAGRERQVQWGAAVSAAIIAQAVSYPFDLVKRRMQLGSYRSIRHCLRDTMQHEGVSGFYRGLTVNTIRVLPVTIVSFSFYDALLGAKNN